MSRGRGGSGRGRGGNHPTGHSAQPAPRRSVRINADRITRAGNTGPTLCGTCNCNAAPVDNNGIGCDRCDLWFHPTPECTGLTTPVLNFIGSEGGTAVVFVCCSCQVTSANPSTNSSTDASNTSVSQCLPQLFNMIKSLAETVANLTTQVQLSMSSQSPRHSDVPPSSNVPSLSHAPTSSTSSPIFREQFFTEMREFEERKKRRDCIIVRGSTSTTEAEFRTEFSGATQHVLGNPVTPGSVQCINPDRGMYRVRVTNLQLRDRVLVNAKKLNESDLYSHLYFARDLTYMQRQDQRDLRARRRVANADTRVTTNVVATPSQDSQQVPSGPSASQPAATATPSQVSQQMPSGPSASQPAATTAPNL